MNRRNFLSTLAAAGVTAMVSPLLAIPLSDSPAAKPALKPGKSTGTTGPLIKIEAIDIRVDTSEDELRNDLIATTKSGEIFTFRCGQMADRASIKRVMPGGLVDVEGFRLGINLPRRDVYEQTACDQIYRMIPPEYWAEIEWREVSYT